MTTTIKYSNHATATDEARRMREVLARHNMKVKARAIRGYVLILASEAGFTTQQIESVMGTCHGAIID